MNITKNEKIMCIICNVLIDKSKKYIGSDFVVFRGKEIGFVKKANTYLQKLLDVYGRVIVTNAEMNASRNRIYRNIQRLPVADGDPLEVPDEDFEYLILIQLIVLQFDEILSKQKLQPEVRTYLKTANTYLKKFLGYVADELSE